MGRLYALALVALACGCSLLIPDRTFQERTEIDYGDGDDSDGGRELDAGLHQVDAGHDEREGGFDAQDGQAEQDAGNYAFEGGSHEHDAGPAQPPRCGQTPVPWEPGVDYGPGNVILMEGTAYECIATAEANLCRLPGYFPPDGAWRSAWRVCRP